MNGEHAPEKKRRRSLLNELIAQVTSLCDIHQRIVDEQRLIVVELTGVKNALIDLRAAVERSNGA